MGELRFLKMHGLGNDFVVLDQRSGSIALSPEIVALIADRRLGVGCDQVLCIEPSHQAHAFMRVFNADGSESGACGNGARCVARILMEQNGTSRVEIETAAGVLSAAVGLRGYTVDMGRPRFGWDEIPLSRAMDTLGLDLARGPLERPTALNLGNPHAVFFVDDLETVPLAELGPELEHDPLFPERANIGVAEVHSEKELRVRVWERGVGLTTACGSGACAALVAAACRGLTGRRAEVLLDGGRLHVEWTDAERVLMTGPATLSFSGELAPELLAT